MKLTKGLPISHILLQADLPELSEASHCRAAWPRQPGILLLLFFLTSLFNLSFNISLQIVVVLVIKPCPTLCNPMDCSPPGSSIHGIFQARTLKCVAISFSRGSSQPKDRTRLLNGRQIRLWAITV